ncbi:MAG: MBL fold metallo-hydrolase [Saprospiraceae bacterium]|nr:MBL fold metallo-hydrolase [Saprospiraceae bacterium]
MRKFGKILLYLFSALVVLVGGILIWSQVKINRAAEQIDREFQAHQPPAIDSLGSVDTLTILPLVDWHTASAELKGEMGVSYLIEAGNETILFDLGYNAEEEQPSPLQHNMDKLGIALEDVDMIVISHDHFDHVGGHKWVEEGSFSPGVKQVPLGEVSIFTPVDKTYPGQSPITTREPTALAPGIATTGTIARRLFMGRIEEQALVVNVDGKGLVLIVGCGHQTIPKLIQRTEEAFSKPIYGIVGGLHMPVPEGRFPLLGGLINAQRFFASGDGPLDPLSQEDINRYLQLLKEKNIQLIGIGGHDSSDQVIAQFKDAFGDRYEEVKVGKKIQVVSGE